jgi:ribosomal protein S27AE
VSIFKQKTCPECSAPHSASAARCGCGFLFDVEQAEDDAHAAELAAQQERIYLDYLAARAAQAEEGYRVAERQLEGDPDSATKSAELLLAQQQMNTARAELTTQSIKARLATERAKTARKRQRAAAVPVTPPAAPAAAAAIPAPAARPTDAAAQPPVQPAVVIKAGPPIAPVSAPAAAPDTMQATLGPKISDRPASAAPAKPLVTTPRASAPTPAPLALANTAKTAPIAKVQAAPPPRNTPPAPPRMAIAPRPPVPPPAVASVQPTAAFRQTQAAKAESILGPREPTPALSARTNGVAAVPNRAAPPPAKSPVVVDTKECPNCTASVALAHMTCRCGYAFSHGAELPAVVLSPSERTILLQGFDLGGAPKRA